MKLIAPSFYLKLLLLLVVLHFGLWLRPKFKDKLINLQHSWTICHQPELRSVFSCASPLNDQ